MKSLATAAAAAMWSLLTGAVQGTQGVEGVVGWGIERRQSTQLPSRIRRRASDVQANLLNDIDMGGYFVTVEVGTPPQKMTLQIDTGSSDLWVPSSTSYACKSGSCSLGSFTSADSSTFDNTGAREFSITYVDESTAKGDYFADVFTIGSSSLTNMTMGLALTTSIPHGLVGIGYELDEAIVGNTSSTSSAYANLPVKMVNEGLINSVAYSLWLNDLDASTSTILFGGIDTDKYQGDLTKIEIYKTTAGSQQYYTSFRVALTSLAAVSSTGTDSLTSTGFPIAVVLDSGTTLSYLPDDIAGQVWTEVGAVYDSEYGLAVIPCEMGSSSGYFSFGLGGTGGPMINVSMNELVLSMSEPAPTFSSGEYSGKDACEFGIQNLSSASTYLLGDTFMRSAYVVYDLVNNEIALAATDFNASSSNIVAFASSGAAIPSATKAPSQVAVTVDTPAYTTPAYTTPRYTAQSGFLGSISGSAPGAAVAGITMAMAMIGAGLFAAWI